MKAYAVIGAGFGDEGKGLVTSYLCSQLEAPLVIRFSGGQQAGHQVMISANKKHIFSNFGSGTLQGVPTYWSKYCTVDPIGIVNEFDLLLEKGGDPQLIIDEQCPVTTPYDVFYNQKMEKLNRHGSCGIGVGATIEREESKYSLLFGDLFSPSLFEIKLELIKQYYGDSVSLDHFLYCCHRLVALKNIKISEGVPKQGNKTLIFEGSQGLLLDQNIGFFPHVTRANTGTKNILSMGYAPKIYLVTRAYQIRHGNGPMTNEKRPHNIQKNPYEEKDTNGCQGEFRRSLLDLDLLLYGIRKDKYIHNTKDKTLVITCLDLVKNEYRFTINRELIYCRDEAEFVHKIKNYLQIENVLLSKAPFSTEIKKENEYSFDICANTNSKVCDFESINMN
jgi:adenylosuccinate synthase